MGSLFSCLPCSKEARGHGKADVVVKIGGSACTIKSKFETLNEVALAAVCDQLAAEAREGRKLAVIHGAGSFGHKQAREYGVSKGADGAGGGGNGLLSERLREGFSKTRLSVTTLNHHVITALVSRGVAAVTVSPCPFVGTVAKKLRGSRLPRDAVKGIRSLLHRGLVPVVHGDAVLDEVQNVAILSGDIWMVELCRELGARSAVFVTDVDGVLTKPPSEKGAELIREILVDKTGKLELRGVSMNCDGAHDVTGGLQAKLQCAADVLLQAPTVEAVYIVRAGSIAAIEAMRGVPPQSGTTLRRHK